MKSTDYITNSDTHPTSGAGIGGAASALFATQHSLLSFSKIFALRALPDSTLSTGSSPSAEPPLMSSNHASPPTHVPGVVGIDGRPHRSALNPVPVPLGDPNRVLPSWKPQELGADFALLSCSCRIEATISLGDVPNDHDARPSAAVLGDIGGEFEGEDIGGDINVEVGEEDIRCFEM